MPPTYLQPAPDYLAQYNAARARSEAEMNQRAAYASAVAEQLGRYTPELQQEVLAPLGKYPTMGEYLFSAPVRGIGKLFGKEGMQKAGLPQEFQLTGPPEAPPVMPKLPSGIPEDMRNFMEQVALGQGYVQRPQQRVSTNVPSEYSSSSPMLKTKGQRDKEAAFEKNMWDMIGKTYQSQQEQDMKKAQINNYNAQAENLRQNVAESQEKLRWGPTMSEWTTLNEIFKDHPELDKLDVVRKFNEAIGSGKLSQQTAEIQLFNLAQQQGYPGNIAQFRALMTKAKLDPARVTYETAYSDPLFALRFRDPEARMQELQRRTVEYTQLMNFMNTGEYGAMTGQEGGALGFGEQPAPAKGGKGGRGKSSVSAAWALGGQLGTPPAGAQAPNRIVPGASEAKRQGKPIPQAAPQGTQAPDMPQELKSMGVIDMDINNLIDEERIKGRQLNRHQVYEMLMNYYRDTQNQGR